jgi:hypothetical protein
VVLHGGGIPIRVSEDEPAIVDQGDPISGPFLELSAQIVIGFLGSPDIQEDRQGLCGAEEVLFETVHKVGPESIVSVQRGNADGEEDHCQVKKQEP